MVSIVLVFILVQAVWYFAIKYSKNGGIKVILTVLEVIVWLAVLLLIAVVASVVLV